MGVEIERKFLVGADHWRSRADRGTVMKQGYLAADPGRTVRVRVAGPEAWLTIKGPADGAVRDEYEYPVPVVDAEALLGLCLPSVVHKTRFLVEHAGHTWEVDVFDGENAPLVTAEVELAAADEVVDLPDWIDREVTGDHRYSNSQLAQHPYSHW